MPVLNEDTFALMCLIEQSETLYDDCFRIATQTLERFHPRGDRSEGIGLITASARTELSGVLRNVLQGSDWGKRLGTQHCSTSCSEFLTVDGPQRRQPVHGSLRPPMCCVPTRFPHAVPPA